MANSILSNNPSQLLTKAKTNVSDWTAYTPTFQGFGTVSAVNFLYRRVGDSIEISGTFQVGTPTATEGQFGLPSGLTIDSAKVPTIRSVGHIVRNEGTAVTKYYTALATGGDNFLNFSTMHKGDALNPLLATNGASLVASGDVVSLQATVPIQGWSSEAEFLAPLVQPKTAYLRYSNATAPIVVGSNTQVPLDEQDGDSSILSLSSNQFTLKSGEYQIDYVFSMWANGTGFALGQVQLYDVTNSQVVSRGTSAGGDGNNYGTIAPSIGGSTVTVTEDTVFEIRANNVLNSGAHTLQMGDAAFTDEKGHVKITKLL